jgi:hypothetical protein
MPDAATGRKADYCRPRERWGDERPAWFEASDWAADGRVIASFDDGHHVLALIDMNGDGEYVAHEIYGRHQGSWYRLWNQDDVGDSPGLGGSGWSSGLVAWIYGRAKPARRTSCRTTSWMHPNSSRSRGHRPAHRLDSFRPSGQGLACCRSVG